MVSIASIVNWIDIATMEVSGIGFYERYGRAYGASAALTSVTMDWCSDRVVSGPFTGPHFTDPRNKLPIYAILYTR